MKLLSLFSGIGGFDLAAHRCGIETTYAAEIDPQARGVFARHFQKTELIDDVRKIMEEHKTEIVCGGWPCQGNSVAGKRAGLSDPRSGLWGEVRRILETCRPQWFIGENVPGLLSVNRGRDFGLILRDLAELGYGTAYRVCDAQYFGVPQRRRRVFVIGCLGDWRSSAEVLFERESLPRDFAKGDQAKQEIAGTITRRIDRGGVNSEGSDNHLVAHTLNAHSGRIDGESETFIPVAHTLRGEGFDASEDGTGRGTPLVACTIPASSGGVSSGLRPVIAIQERMVSENVNAGPQGKGYQENISFTLEARTTPQAVCFHENQRGELTESKIHGALKTGGGKPGQGYPALRSSMGVRRLTPLECERLQGFPESELHVTIEICSGHQKNSVNAAIQNLRLQKHVGNVEKSRLERNAEFAEKNFFQSDQRINKHAHLLAHISCVENEVEIRNHERLLLSAFNAARKGESRLPMQSEDFVRLIAGTCITADLAIQGGREELHLSEQCSMYRQNGKVLVRLYGSETMRRASDAMHGSSTGCVLTRCTIESLLGSRSIEQKLATLFCSVAHAMSGFTLAKTLCENSLTIELSHRSAWTRYSRDGKEISDSARYRMIGNAVAVPCVEWIMRRIISQSNGESAC